MPPDPRLATLFREFHPNFATGRIIELLLVPPGPRLEALREARLWLENEIGLAAHARLAEESRAKETKHE